MVANQSIPYWLFLLLLRLLLAPEVVPVELMLSDAGAVD